MQHPDLWATESIVEAAPSALPSEAPYIAFALASTDLRRGSLWYSPM